MITDKDRIDWLCKRVTYLEHSDNNGVICQKQTQGGYWPQKESENDYNTVIEEFADIPLLSYIDAMIKEESK